MVATAVVRFAHAHTVVCEVHIAVVAEELRHRCDCGFGERAGVQTLAGCCTGDGCGASRSLEVEMFGELENLSKSVL